jgi:predicted GIY-YIG superfamily endonuclease
MRGFIYLINSKKFPNKFYLGSTSNPPERIKQHNSGFTNSTRFYRPWFCVLVINVGSIEEARIIEKYIKQQKEKLCVKNVIKTLNYYYKKNL